MTFYEVQRTMTCKTIGSKDNYTCWDKKYEKFSTISEVKQFLKDEYGDCKRSTMWKDTESGVIKVGRIYHYNTPKTSYDDTAKNNQDRVTVSEVKSKIIII